MEGGTIVIFIACYVVIICTIAWCKFSGQQCYYATIDYEEIIAELEEGFAVEIASETEVQSSSITNIWSEASEISTISIVDSI